MKNTIPLILLILFSFSASAQTSPSAIPELKNFKLLPSEVPKCFVLRPVDEEAKSVGFTENPGNVTSDYFIMRLYPNINKNTIAGIRLAMYVKPNQDQELGVNIIEYKSAAMLKTEVNKLRAQRGTKYFTRENYIIIVWSDAGSFVEQVAAIASKLKRRLILHEFRPKAEDETAATDSVITN